MEENLKMGKGNDSKYRDKSTTQERCEEGSLFKTWTQTWGVSIKPVYSMDKVRFEIIDRSKSGKSFNVDVPAKKDNVLDFTNFCEEVLWSPDKPYKRMFVKVMAQELSDGVKYPKRYKWVTGFDGEKSVGFANSTKGGYVLNANNGDLHVNIPLSDVAIEDICIEFMETYAKRLEELKTLRNKGMDNYESFFKKNGETVDTDSDSTENKEEAATNQQSKADEPKADATPKSEAQSSAAEKPAKTNDVAENTASNSGNNGWVRDTYHYKTAGAVDMIKDGPKTGYAVVSAILTKSDGSEIENLIVFKPDFINEKKSQFDKFVEMAAQKSLEGKIIAEQKGKSNYFAVDFTK